PAASELPARTRSRSSVRSGLARALPVLSWTKRSARSRSYPAASMIASSRVVSPSVARSSRRRAPSSVRSNSANRFRRSAGSELSTIWPWRWSRSTTEAWSGASLMPLATSPVAVTADQRKDGIAIPALPSGVGVHEAQHLVERRLAVNDGEKAALEDGAHTTLDSRPLDLSVVGAGENQPVDRRARHQQFADREAPAISGAAALRAADGAVQRDRGGGRELRQFKPV